MKLTDNNWDKALVSTLSHISLVAQENKKRKKSDRYNMCRK